MGYILLGFSAANSSQNTALIRAGNRSLPRVHSTMAHVHVHSSDTHSQSNGLPSADEIVHSNRAYFDNLASTPAPAAHSHSHARVAANIVSSIRAHPGLVPLSEATTRLLDYACGTGAVSRLLLPHVASIVGVDVSAGAVAEFNTAARNQGLDEGEMRAVTADLVTGEGDVAALADDRFDVVVCSLAFHHMPSPRETTAALARRLVPGGVFVCIDFRAHEDLGEQWKSIIPHNGFGEDQVREWYVGAGLEEPVFRPVGEDGKGVTLLNRGLDDGELTVRREVFMAIGKKP